MSKFCYLYSALFLAGFVSCLHAIPQYHNKLTTPAQIESSNLLLARQDSSSAQCGFQGNTDIYGLGIRIGYYTQAFASWLANFFILQESKSLRPVNTLFMFAMFLGLLWISHAPSETFAIEAFLLLQLLITTWFVGVKDRSKWSIRYWKYDPARAIIREVSVIAILVYNVWFWWYGLDAFKPTPCGTYILFVTKIDLYGWYRSAHRVLSIISIFFQMIMSVGDVLQLLNYWRNREMRASKHFSDLSKRLQRESTPSPKCVADLPVTANISTFKYPENAQYEDRACSPILESFLSHPIDLPIATPSQPEAGSYSTKTLSPAKTIQKVVTEREPVKTVEVPPVHTTPPCIPSSQPNQNPTNTPTFDALLIADKYTTAIFEPSAQQTRRSYHIPYTPITIYIPSPHSLFSPFPSLLHHPLRLSLLIPLYIHIYSLHAYPFHVYPTLLHRALTSPHHTSLSPSTLSTFLILRTTTFPAHNRKLYFLPSALMTLFFAVVLVLAIELCIYWNGISGVHDMGTVGQLVPFVLGVGGFVKVFWSWAREGRGEEEGQEIGKDVERCAEVYYGLKEQREHGAVVHV